MNRDTRIAWINRLLLPLLNIITAFAVTALVFWLIDVNPIEAAQVLLYVHLAMKKALDIPSTTPLILSLQAWQ